MRFPVSFTIPKYVEAILETPTYQYNRSGRLPWLQKVAFWLLDQTGAIRTETITQFEQVIIDVNEHKIHELLEKISSSAMVYGTRPEVILVGPDIYQGILTDGDLPPGAMSFDVKQTLTAGRGVDVYGFKIVLVPHMVGFLPLPKWRQMN